MRVAQTVLAWIVVIELFVISTVVLVSFVAPSVRTFDGWTTYLVPGMVLSGALTILFFAPMGPIGFYLRYRNVVPFVSEFIEESKRPLWIHVPVIVAGIGLTVVGFLAAPQHASVKQVAGGYVLSTGDGVTPISTEQTATRAS